MSTVPLPMTCLLSVTVEKPLINPPVVREPCEETLTSMRLTVRLRACQQFRSDVEAISTILYPNDAGEHGRSTPKAGVPLFVSAGSILRTYEHEHGHEDHFADHVCIHTNDTHPRHAT